MNRRVLLSILVIAFIGIVAGCILQTRHGLSKGSEDQSFEKQIFAMDTVMDFMAYGENAEEAVAAAAARVQELDELLSTGKASSEISRLNREGSLEVSEDTAAIFLEAMDIYEKTGGLFDFTIYPVMKLWGFPTGEYHVASEEELARTLPLVDASRVQLEQENKAPEASSGLLVTLGEGQEVDFGGIAKGYTAAAVMDLFREYGITSGRVTLGGNVQVLNTKPDGSCWNIGIRDPEGGPTDLAAVLSADNQAVVTSGGYERYFEEDGQTYIHIIDPRTGRPAEPDLLSVTIVSEDGTLADALSTSLYIMGLEDACDYWREHREEFEMILITDQKTIYVTEGLTDSFQSDWKWETVQPS